MERSKQISWEYPMTGVQQAMHMTGLEYMQAMVRGDLPAPPIVRTLDFEVDHVEVGTVTFAFVPQEFHYNPIGMVHGGVLSTLLDSAMGCALQTQLPAGVGYATLELKVNFLKSVTLKTGRVQGIGRVIQQDNRTALTEARLHDTSGILYAHATSTCLIIKP